MLLARGRAADAARLLAELEQTPDIRRDTNYAAALPALVRCALGARDAGLAARLAEGVESFTPLHEHALRGASAQLTEARGLHADAAERYAEAAEEWRTFGDVPERAYALLGRGRCMHVLGDRGAAAPLREARALFESLGYVPALAETDAVLRYAEAVSTSVNRISWAPSQRNLLPSSGRFSPPSTIVAKWFPANGPAFEAKLT